MGRPRGSRNGRQTLVRLTCKGCGETFGVKPSKAAARAYCSMECRRLGERACESCGAVFYPKARAARYCSRSCSGAAKANGEPGHPTCPGCGKTFRVKPSHVARRVYCSLACSKLKPRDCAHCGVAFQPKASAQRYCSSKCFGADRRTIPSRDLILSNIERRGECWIWMGYIGAAGYGTIVIAGRSVRAHRLSHEVFKGPIASGMSVCHSCDVRACVNPDHLWLGTATDNMRDRDAKGRRRNPWTKKPRPATGASAAP